MRTIGSVDSQLLIEAFVVGLMVVVVGLIIHTILVKVKPDLVGANCEGWNKHHIMEICLFLTGAATHLAAEFSGLNQWYVNQYK